MKSMKFFYMVLMISGGTYALQHNEVSFPLPPSIHTLTFNVNNNNTQELTASTTRINPAHLRPQSIATPSTQTTTWEWLCNNGNYKRLLVGATVVGCGALAVKVWLMATTLNDHAWSEWGAEIPVAVLSQSADKNVARALFDEIKKRYTHCQQDGGLLDPIICFMNDNEKEKRQLEYVLYIRSWLATPPLSYMVPSALQNVAPIQEKIERLRCLKKILITWLGEYKIEHA